MCAHGDGSSDLQTALRNRCTETVVTESIISGCLSAAGFASSLMICLAIYRNARLRSTIHMYILSYAIINLMKSLLVMPLTLGILIKGEWISSSTAVCQFQGIFISVLGIETVLTMTMTAIDRYVAVAHLAQYLTLFKRKYACGALSISWLISFAVPLSFTITGNNFVFHPGYGTCREQATNDTYLQASILKLTFTVLPFCAIAACFCIAEVNAKKTYKAAKLRAKERRMVNISAWREEEGTTRLLAALILGNVVFWVPSYVCDLTDAFTHEYCLPRSVYLLSTLILNSSCFFKPFIIAFMDEDFKMEFKRILKLRKTRKVVDINVERNSEFEDPKLMPETRKYYCETKELDYNTGPDESTV